MTTRNLGFFVALLSRFWHTVTVRNLGFLPHFCHGFATLRQRQGRVFCLTFVPVLSRRDSRKAAFFVVLLSRFCRGFVPAARAFSFAHRDRRKHKNSPGTSSASGLFACRGSKCPCGAFYVSLEDFTTARRNRVYGANRRSRRVLHRMGECGIIQQ